MKKTLGLLALLGTLSLTVSCASPSSELAGKGGEGGEGGGFGGAGGSAGAGGAGGVGGDVEELCGPLTDKPLDALTPCCEKYGGAHCIDNVPPDFVSLVAACPGGGYCVPDDFILKGAAVNPEQCASIGGADGRWISGCVPQVDENAALLPKDDAHPGMFCVPCINPIDKMETGVCSLGTTCGGGGAGGGTGGTGGAGGSGPTCDNPGMGIDPSLFPECPSMCGGRCVNKQLLPNPNDPAIKQLGECEAGSGLLCVPDELISSQGLAVPETCDWYGLEGRCMSECIPQIQDQIQKGVLIKGTCADHHWCTPCFDPTTKQPTGACTLQCDAGPDPAKEHEFPVCCNGIGTCVPPALAGSQADQLGKEECPDGADLLCAPNDLMPGSSYVPKPCTPEFNFVELSDPNHQYGVCLPDCLPALDSIFLKDSGECGDKYKCAPCWQPGLFSDKKSDAPGCKY